MLFRVDINVNVVRPEVDHPKYLHRTRRKTGRCYASRARGPLLWDVTCCEGAARLPPVCSAHPFLLHVFERPKVVEAALGKDRITAAPVFDDVVAFLEEPALARLQCERSGRWNGALRV